MEDCRLDGGASGVEVVGRGEAAVGVGSTKGGSSDDVGAMKLVFGEEGEGLVEGVYVGMKVVEGI